jgi:hypothetical protein
MKKRIWRDEASRKMLKKKRDGAVRKRRCDELKRINKKHWDFIGPRDLPLDCLPYDDESHRYLDLAERKLIESISHDLKHGPNGVFWEENGSVILNMYNILVRFRNKLDWDEYIYRINRFNGAALRCIPSGIHSLGLLQVTAKLKGRYFLKNEAGMDEELGNEWIGWSNPNGRTPKPEH